MESTKLSRPTRRSIEAGIRFVSGRCRDRDDLLNEKTPQPFRRELPLRQRLNSPLLKGPQAASVKGRTAKPRGGWSLYPVTPCAFETARPGIRECAEDPKRSGALLNRRAKSSTVRM